MDETQIAEIRRFNRAFARWLGLFDEHYSKTDYSPADLDLGQTRSAGSVDRFEECASPSARRD